MTTVEQNILMIDKDPDESDTITFSHYSPEGKIPVIIMGGKYYRIGAGESLGEETERQVLTAFLCKITDNSIGECSNAEIASLVDKI